MAQTADRNNLENSLHILTDLCIRSALSSSEIEDIKQDRPLVLAIEVPSLDWINPISKAVARLGGGDTHFVVRTGTAADKNTLSDSNVAVSISAGETVIGLSVAAQSLMPKGLLATAKRIAKVDSPDHKTLAKVIRKCTTGRIPPYFRELPVTTLGFTALLSCIVTGSTAAETAARLKTAIERGKSDPGIQDVPSLSTAIEYGTARDWGLNLARDIADYRAGRITWNEIDRGAVLHGPPGTGKSMFAAVLAKACGVALVSTSIAELFAGGAYLDHAIKGLREVFSKAKAAAPAILFFDELNALPNIDTVGDRNRDYWAPIIYDFYLQLDAAMNSQAGIVVLGSTNRISDIHPAILRPGRLERAVFVGPPDAAGLANILRHHLGDELPRADLSALCKAGEGATGAVAMEWIRAARRRARYAGRALNLGDLEAQIKRGETRSDTALRRIAVHEAGHAVVAHVLGMAIQHVSLKQTPGTNGSTSFTMVDLEVATIDDIEATLLTLLAGRAAEECLLGSVSAGAGGGSQSDLAMATDLAVSMRTTFGLKETLHWRAAPNNGAALIHADPELRSQVESDLQTLNTRVTALIHDHRPAIEALASALITKFDLGHEDVREIVGSNSNELGDGDKTRRCA